MIVCGWRLMEQYEAYVGYKSAVGTNSKTKAHIHTYVLE